jgi:hypothetical protein
MEKIKKSIAWKKQLETHRIIEELKKEETVDKSWK